MQHIVFGALSMLSHIGGSLFFAKPRFNTIITAIIWLIYGVVHMILPMDMPAVSFFASFGILLVLFFVTTTGCIVERGFLFFSYATTYACFSTLFNMLNHTVSSMAIRISFAFVLIAMMQRILYKVLLPSFRKAARHIRQSWGIFYGVVLSFGVLIAAQSVFAMTAPVSGQESIVFFLTTLAFFLTYIAIFNSVNPVVDLSLEKQKTLQTEFLQAQAEIQAKEAQLVREGRHDMRFHYQALMSMAQSGDIDKIIDYLKLQSESLETMAMGRFCENETVNTILRVFYQKATDAHIAMEIRAAAKPDISVPPPSLVTVIANILENALHGAESSKSTAPYIKVSIKHKAGRLVIHCENTCNRSLHFEEMPEHLQGVGVHSVISAAEKYNGSCRFSAADGVFRCTVIMDE